MARFPLTEEEKRRGLHTKQPWEGMHGPHTVRLGGVDYRNPAGLYGNAIPDDVRVANGMGTRADPYGRPSITGAGAGDGAVPAAAMPAPMAAPAAPVAAPAAPVAEMNYSPIWMGPSSPKPNVPQEPLPDMPKGAGNMFMTEGAGLLPAPAQGLLAPKQFTDSDGMVRAGYNQPIGGLVPTDIRGVPLKQEMMPVQGLSHGSMEIGVPADPNRNFSPRIALRDEPPAAPTTDQWARTANAIGGFRAPEMTRADAGIQADLAATRTERWNQRGSTTNVDRRLEQKRSQGAALDALTRQTDEQIRVAQGTPQAVASSGGVANYTPGAEGKAGEWRETVRPVATGSASQVLREPASGMTAAQLMQARLKASPRKKGQFNPLMEMILQNIADPTEREQRRQELDQDSPGDPEQLKMIDKSLQWFRDRQNGTGGGEVPGAAQVPAAGAGGAEVTPAANTWDQYKRKNTGG